MIRIAVKFCGGCDPGYDRVDYLEQIRSLGDMAKIEFVRMDDGDCDSLLLINGCQRACAEKELKSVPGIRIISLKDGKLNPEDVLKMLLK